MMPNLFIKINLLFLTVGVVHGRGGGLKKNREKEGDDRDRTFDIPLVKRLCRLPNIIIPFGIQCECDVEVVGLNAGLTAEYECAWEDLCFGPLCTTPSFAVGIDFSILPVSVGGANGRFCYSDTSIGPNLPLPNFCIGLSGSGLNVTLGDFSFNPNRNAKGFAVTQLVDKCSVQVGDNLCTSCEACNEGKGIVFDCTNINTYMIQSQCTDFAVLGKRMLTNDGTAPFLPKFDSLQ